jgi:high-affinity nickel-transport protein
VNAASDHFDVIGGGICGAFVVGGGMSVLLYGPWRRWVEKGRLGRRSAEAGEVELGELAVSRTDIEFEEEKGGGSRSLARELEEP